MGSELGLIFALVGGSFGLGNRQLTLNFQTELWLLLQLNAMSFRVDFQIVNGALEMLSGLKNQNKVENFQTWWYLSNSVNQWLFLTRSSSSSFRLVSSNWRAKVDFMKSRVSTVFFSSCMSRIKSEFSWTNLARWLTPSCTWRCSSSAFWLALAAACSDFSAFFSAWSYRKKTHYFPC